MNKTHQEFVFVVMIWDSYREGYTVINLVYCNAN